MKDKMLIEFYDQENLENIIALENDEYNRVVYLCVPFEPDEEEKQTLNAYVRRRFHLSPEYIHVRELSISSTCAVLDTLLKDSRGSCTIDLTGGSEIFSAAAGFYVAQNPQKYIMLRQYDMSSGKCVFTHPDKSAWQERTQTTITVSEAVALHGAAVLESTRFSSSGRLDEEILRLWAVVKDVPRQWNHFCTLPAFTPIPYRTLEEKGVYSKGDLAAYEVIAKVLRKQKIMINEISQQVEGREYRVFSLDVPEEAHLLYEKGGNLLEYYCALAVERAGVFRDCRVSVSLDWDGDQRKKPVDVRNEVDVMMAYGHIPVFVSCKNTRVENEYLYEIQTMARHYGGRYAKPVIVSNAENLPVVRKRAEEMGVLLIDAIHKMTLDEFVGVFQRNFPGKDVW